MNGLLALIITTHLISFIAGSVVAYLFYNE
jgi:hypothetical protein